MNDFPFVTIRTLYPVIFLFLFSIAGYGVEQNDHSSFLRFADSINSPETRQYVGIESLRVLFAPASSEPFVYPVLEDGTIVINPRKDFFPLEKDSMGLRLQVQYLLPAFLSPEKKRYSYTFLSRSDIENNEVFTVRPPGKPELQARVWARQVMPQTMKIESFPVMVPEKAYLDFSVALQNDWRIPAGAQVRFMITATDDTTQVTLYDEIIRRHEPSESPRWKERSIDLSAFANKQTRFSFNTEKVVNDLEMQQAFPLWGNPILYTTASEQRNKPNIIMIALDTLRADHLGCYGYHRNTSPNIDKFAAENILFENAFAPAPWTTPSFASIFTGRLPAVHKAGLLSHNFVLDNTFETLSEHARNAGMLTAAFTEGLAVCAQLGFSRGFDRYSDGNSPLSRLPGSAEATFRNAANWLDTYGHLPFFLFVHSYEPHDPYNAPLPWGQMFTDDKYTGDSFENPEHAKNEEERQYMRDRYDGSIAYADHWTGWFLDHLKNTGLMENTVVLLFSDHGEGFWEHGHCVHHSSVYDEVLHVPVILALPGPNNLPERVEQMIGSVDIFATILDILNLSIDSGLDSQSLLPLIQNNAQELYTRKYVSSELHFLEVEQDAQTGVQIPIEPLYRSIRSQEDKYIVTNRRSNLQQNPSSPDFAVEEELFDLKVDPDEKNNLAATLPAKTEQMRKIFQDYFAAFGVDVTVSTTNDTAPTQLIDEDNLEALRTLGYL